MSVLRLLVPAFLVSLVLLAGADAARAAPVG